MIWVYLYDMLRHMSKCDRCGLERKTQTINGSTDGVFFFNYINWLS